MASAFLTQVKAFWVPSIFSKTITSLCFLSQRFHQIDAVWMWASQLTSFIFILSSLNEDGNTYHKGMGQNGMTLQCMSAPAMCYKDLGRYFYLGSHFPLITLSCIICQALASHWGRWCISFQLLPWQITINVVAWVCYVTALRVRSPRWASFTRIKVSGGWHLWRLWGIHRRIVQHLKTPSFSGPCSTSMPAMTVESFSCPLFRPLLPSHLVFSLVMALGSPRWSHLKDLIWSMPAKSPLPCKVKIFKGWGN